MANNVVLAGQLEKWPSKSEMAFLLRDAGLDIYVGKYSIRINDCEYFNLQQYGGDLGEPCFDASASDLGEMLKDSRLVSGIFAAAHLRHRFELYDDNDMFVGYLHHNWPQLPELDLLPFAPDYILCPNCKTYLTGNEYEFLCYIIELGNVARYRCTNCNELITDPSKE